MKPSSSALPPGPRHPKLVQSVAWWSRAIPFLERCRSRYGHRFTVRLVGGPPFVMISDPDEIKQVFTAPPDVLHPGAGARVLEPVVGERSVILLDEDAHLTQRKLMLPAFHGDRIDALTGLMNEVAYSEVAGWPRDESTALHPRLQALTLEIILRAVFGLEEGERKDRLSGLLAELLEFGTNPLSLAWTISERLAPLAPPYRRFIALREEIDTLLFELIAERRGDAEQADVLSLLLAAHHDDGSPMADEEIRDELLTLLVAGHETTASELAWAFERLVREPVVLARLRDEVDAGESDDYLTAVLYETLRRRPVIPNAAPRLTKKPIEVGGWEYPVGVCLVPNAYLVQHDPAIYPDPYAFKPERWLGTSPGTYTWIPFGGGRRRCLGASFAQTEMKVVLKTVLANCDVRAGGNGVEAPIRRAITISPASGAATVLHDRAPVAPATEALAL